MLVHEAEIYVAFIPVQEQKRRLSLCQESKKGIGRSLSWCEVS